MYISKFGFLVWIGIIGYVVGLKGYKRPVRSMRGECIKSCGSVLPLNVMFMDRQCIRDDDGCLHCKYFGCPLVECFHKGRKVVPDLTPDRRCLVCKGRCVYGGEVYKKGDRFMAVDDHNTCRCLNGGRVICSMKSRRPSVSGFCEV